MKTARFLAGLVFICLLVLGLACEIPEKGVELEIMSFNIRYGTANDGANRWELRRNLVLDLIRESDADLIGLQEALRFQIDEIRQALPVYGEIGVGRDDGLTAGEYSVILFKTSRFEVDTSGTFWFSETPEVSGSTDWGNDITRICTWARFIETASGRANYLFNVHLDHRSQPSREKSVQLLAKQISERKFSDPVFVTGDFNAGEDNPAIVYFKGKQPLTDSTGIEFQNPVPFVDTFRQLHPNATEVGTFNGFEGRQTGDKIDFVFAPENIEILEAEINRRQPNGRCPSDHFPVSAKVRF